MNVERLMSEDDIEMHRGRLEIHGKNDLNTVIHIYSKNVPRELEFIRLQYRFLQQCVLLKSTAPESLRSGLGLTGTYFVKDVIQDGAGTPLACLVAVHPMTYEFRGRGCMMDYHVFVNLEFLELA